MRVAVAVPSLSAATPLGGALDCTIAAMIRRGLEVEAFAEMDKARAGGPAPTYHYLRFPERHDHRPFDRALWPLGRDARTWEPAWVLCRRWPGVVWAQDGPLHHLLLGGVAMRGGWSDYGRMLEERFHEEAGPVLSLFAAGWSTRATCRHLDPVPALLKGQGGRLAVTDHLADRLVTVGEERASSVPLPIIPAVEAAPASKKLQAAVIGLDAVQPGPVLAGLAEVLERRPDVAISIALPEPTYHVRVAPAAHAAGILDRVRWILSPAPDVLANHVAQCHIGLLLDADPNAIDRALLEHAMVAGKPTLVPDVPAFEHLPDPPVTKLPAGRRLGLALAVALDALVSDSELRRGLSDAGRRWARRRPDPEVIAERLDLVLREAPALRLTSAPSAVWSDLESRVLAKVMPPVRSESTVRLVERTIGSILPAAAAPDR